MRDPVSLYEVIKMILKPVAHQHVCDDPTTDEMKSAGSLVGIKSSEMRNAGVDIAALHEAISGGSPLPPGQAEIIDSLVRRARLSMAIRVYRLTRASTTMPHARRLGNRARSRCSRGQTARHRAASTTRDDGSDPDPAGDTEEHAGSVAAPCGGAR